MRMRTDVIEVSLDFKPAALSRLRRESKWKIDLLAVRWLNSDPLLVGHRRRRAFLRMLGSIRILHVLGLDNDVVVLVKLILEISTYSSDCNLRLRLALNQLTLNSAPIAVSAELTQSQLRIVVFPYEELLLLVLLCRGFRSESILVLHYWNEVSRFHLFQGVYLLGLSKNCVVFILMGFCLSQ